MDNNPQHNASVFGKIAQKYTQEYFDDTSDFGSLDKFLKEVTPKGRVLDIACGPGMLAKYIASQGFQAEGIDLSPQMIEVANKKVPEAKFKVMDMRKLDYPDASFDGMILAYGLIYIPSVELPATLNELNRVLKPGGSIFMINQEGEPDHTVNDAMIPQETLYVNFFSPESLSQALQAAGFSVSSQEVMAVDNPLVMADKILYTIAQKTA